MKEKTKATIRVARSIIERSMEAEDVSPEISDRLERTAGNMFRELMDEIRERPSGKEEDSDFARRLMRDVGYTPGKKVPEDRGVINTRKRMMLNVGEDIKEQMKEFERILGNSDNRDATIALFENKLKERGPSLELKDEIEKAIQQHLVRTFKSKQIYDNPPRPKRKR